MYLDLDEIQTHVVWMIEAGKTVFMTGEARSGKSGVLGSIFDGSYRTVNGQFSNSDTNLSLQRARVSKPDV